MLHIIVKRVKHKDSLLHSLVFVQDHVGAISRLSLLVVFLSSVFWQLMVKIGILSE